MNNEIIKKILAVYPPVFTKCEEGGYSVEIPDLPGCVSEGETLEEAREMIEEAATGWILTALECGYGIPTSRHGRSADRQRTELVH